jgi:hypothetical protein
MLVNKKIEGDNEPQPSTPREEGQVPFVFVGTMESIANAKVLLEYHLVHLKVSFVDNLLNFLFLSFKQYLTGNQAFFDRKGSTASNLNVFF